MMLSRTRREKLKELKRRNKSSLVKRIKLIARKVDVKQLRIRNQILMKRIKIYRKKTKKQKMMKTSKKRRMVKNLIKFWKNRPRSLSIGKQKGIIHEIGVHQEGALMVERKEVTPE